MEIKTTSQEMIDNSDESPASRPNYETVNGYRYIKDNCEHYKTAISIHIFPCCDKPYNCLKCHDAVENHKFISAKQGYCRLCKTWYENGRGSNCNGCKKSF